MGSSPTRGRSFFLRKSDGLGCAVLLCLVVLFDLACFFLSSFSHFSLKHVNSFLLSSSLNTSLHVHSFSSSLNTSLHVHSYSSSLKISICKQFHFLYIQPQVCTYTDSVQYTKVCAIDISSAVQKYGSTLIG